MRYVAIDLETSGLDPQLDMILEFAAVVYDPMFNTEELPSFQCFIDWQYIFGNPKALLMNVRCLEAIVNRTGNLIQIGKFAPEFWSWLRKWYGEDEHITFAGKNFGSFDRNFLLQVPYWTDLIKMHHRCIDPAMFYWREGDEKLPSLSECLERSGRTDFVLHTALDDARAVVHLIQNRMKNGVSKSRPENEDHDSRSQALQKG